MGRVHSNVLPSILLALSFSLSLSPLSWPPPFDPLCTSFYVFPRATETRVTRGLSPHLGRLFVASAHESNYFRPAAYKRDRTIKSAIG